MHPLQHPLQLLPQPSHGHVQPSHGHLHPLHALPQPSQGPTPHAPVAQTALVACGGVAQAFPHAPQCAGAVLRLVSQPLLALLSQLPQPGSQAAKHRPVSHVGVAWLVLHAFPHAPQ